MNIKEAEESRCTRSLQTQASIKFMFSHEAQAQRVSSPLVTNNPLDSCGKTQPCAADKTDEQTGISCALGLLPQHL